MGLYDSHLIFIQKLNVDWILTLAFFGSKFESSTDSRAIDIILEGQDPVLPRDAKMTFIVPKGGLEEASLRGRTCLASLATGMMQKLLQLSFSNQLVQMVSQISTVFCSMSLVLVILAIKALIAPHGVSCYLIWPFEEWLILNLL